MPKSTMTMPLCPFRGGVCDLADAVAGGGEGGAHVEADVVEEGFWVGDYWGKEDDDGIGAEVDADEFGAAEGGGEKYAVGEGDAAGVEDPEAVLCFYDDALHAD